ncbi:MAG: hypothetical protein Q9191_002015 [Dirinaria sp. TL-2023a]
MDLKPKPRRAGLSRNAKLGYSLLEYGPHRKSTPRPPQSSQIPRPPSPDDIEAPPQGSSDEAPSDGASTDSELGLGRATKRRKKSHERASDDDIGSGELSTAPSNIRSSSFTTSQKSKLEDDSEEHFLTWSQGRSSQSGKLGRTYTKLKNIHKATQETPETKASKKQSNVANDDEATGFRMPDIIGLCAKADESGPPQKSSGSFKIPPVQSLRSQRAARRSSRDDGFSPGGKPTNTFKLPELAAAEKLSPAKTFVQPRRAVVDTSTSPSSKALNTFKAPFRCTDYNDLGTADMQGLLEQVKGSTDAPLKIRTSDSSITESSMPSISRDAASSSSISSPPSSPGDFETFISKSSADGKELPVAVCPVCKEPVDCTFLEEFDGGKRLRSRDQLRFCKAHRARSARSEWSAKGYPEIDWQHFDRRMEKYHPVIDGILKGTRPSYSRNAFEQTINSKKFRTMKEAYQDSESMEGLSPGYYGSRGARAMIENIASAFASKIRRLAVSDKVIMTAGVAAYIQAVLAPELAALLVMDDMNVDEENARAILRDSINVGNLLNEEEDEAVEVMGDDNHVDVFGGFGTQSVRTRV